MVESIIVYAAIAQLVERIHGKDEVSGSSPDRGSKKLSTSWQSTKNQIPHSVHIQRCGFLLFRSRQFFCISINYL